MPPCSGMGCDRHSGPAGPHTHLPGGPRLELGGAWHSQTQVAAEAQACPPLQAAGPPDFLTYEKALGEEDSHQGGASSGGSVGLSRGPRRFEQVGLRQEKICLSPAKSGWSRHMGRQLRRETGPLAPLAFPRLTSGLCWLGPQCPNLVVDF